MVTWYARPSRWTTEIAATENAARDKRLVDYQPYWAAHARLLEAAGRAAEAHEAYSRAIGLEADPAVREFLQRRRAGLT